MPETSPEDLKDCTVRISHEGGQNHDGSGFFVTSGLILTCAHVCQKAKGKPIFIHWREKPYPVRIKFCSKDIETLDLALLELVDSTIKTPHIYLEETINIGDELYNFGYPEKYPQGDVGTFEAVDFDGKHFFKFKGDLVHRGLSGSPLLNLGTGKVCGIVVISLNSTMDFGGRAISTKTIFEHLSEVKEFHKSFNKKENPFIPQTGKIEDINLVFGREAVIQNIFELLNTGSGVALIGESGMGKSSLLNCIKSQAEKKLTSPRKPIYLDLGNFTTDNDFYYELCCQVGINCDYDNPFKGIRLSHELKKHRLLLLLDGLWKDMNWQGFTNPVRNQLRSLANEFDAPLRLVVAADKPLTQLFADSGKDSPFENVCIEIQLQPWDETTIRNFINHRLADTNIHFSEVQIQELIRKSRGNPQKLMMLCYEIYKKYCQ
jgi:type II secretory pathway predicted ATPase ExeA